MKTRQATVADIPLIVEFVQALLRELDEGDAPNDQAGWDDSLCRSFLARSNNAVFVAENETGSAIGVITLDECFALYAQGAYGTIRELYVLSEARSTGVGGLLVRRAADHDRSVGWKRLEVTAPDGPRWLRTVAFYSRDGFTPAGPKPKLMLDE